jgi:hypothetical protein
MATKTLYFLDTRNAEGWENIGETPVAASTSGTGWVVGTGATNRSKLEAATERSSSTFDANTYPTGGLDTTLKDAFRSENPYSGSFASGNWVFHFVVRAVSVGGAQDGAIRFRLWKADADGSNATEITAAIQSASTVTNVSTSADFDSTLTVNPGAFSISNQYLFVQIAWERTGAGGMTTADIDFRTGSSSTVGTRITTSDFTAAATPVYTQGKWRWYSDAATDGAMSALAAEQTNPTLTQAQMQNGIIRLRVQIDETAGGAGTTGALTLEYSEDGTNWNIVQEQTPVSGEEGWWFRYANGLATNGGTTTSAFLTGTTAQGKYHETGSGTETLAASGKQEIDFAVYVHWPPPDSTTRFRIKNGGTVLALDTGATEIQLTTSTAANRGNTITRLDGDALQKTSREVRFGPWERLWYDTVNSLWWFSTVQYATPTIARLYSWDGNPANGWQAATTLDFGAGVNGYQSLSAATFKTISGVSYVFLHWGSSSTTRRVVRGTLTNATTISWGTVTSISQSSDRHRSIGMDDGGFLWIAGTTAATGVWAIRSTSANDTSAWQTAKTASDTGVASGDVLTVIGLASDKAMVVWRSGSVLKFATVTNAGGFSAVGQVNATASAGPEDWGIARGGGFVYLIHSDSTSAGGNWVLRVFDETGSTWATGTSPVVSGQPTSNDGIPLTLNGSDLYAFGTFAAAEGGQDRKVQYIKYTGPGTGGSWGSLTDITPAGSRGNGDHITAPRVPGGGKLVIGWAFNDDDLVGPARSAEYHYITVSAGTVFTKSVSATITLSPSVVKNGNKVVSAGISLAASIIKNSNKVLSRTLSLSPSTTKSANKSLSAGVGLGATITKNSNKILSGAVTLSPSITKNSNKVVEAGVTLSASIIKKTGKGLSAGLSLIASKVATFVPGGGGGGTVFTKTVSATITLSPSITKAVGKRLSRSLSLTPSVRKATGKRVSAALNLSANIRRRTHHTAIATLSLLSSVSRKTHRTLSSTLVLSPSVTKRTRKIVQAGISLGASILQVLREGGEVAGEIFGYLLQAGIIRGSIISGGRASGGEMRAGDIEGGEISGGLIDSSTIDG